MSELQTNDDGYIDESAHALAQGSWQNVDQESAVDSIDSDSDMSDFSTTSTRDIQREWDENMEQAHQLFSIVIFPFVGRWIGKKVSYWIWTKYLQHHYRFKSIAAALQ